VPHHSSYPWQGCHKQHQTVVLASSECDARHDVASFRAETCIPGRIVNASPARRMARPGSFEEVPVRPPDDAPMEINGAGRVGQSFRSSPEDTCPKVLRRGPSNICLYMYIYFFNVTLQMHQMRFHDGSEVGFHMLSHVCACACSF